MMGWWGNFYEGGESCPLFLCDTFLEVVWYFVWYYSVCRNTNRAKWGFKRASICTHKRHENIKKPLNHGVKRSWWGTGEAGFEPDSFTSASQYLRGFAKSRVIFCVIFLNIPGEDAVKIIIHLFRISICYWGDIALIRVFHGRAIMPPAAKICEHYVGDI